VLSPFGEGYTFFGAGQKEKPSPTFPRPAINYSTFVHDNQAHQSATFGERLERISAEFAWENDGAARED
jgi:hypothetical protein